MDCQKQAVVQFRRAGGAFTPKWHLWMHLTKGIYEKGNPTAYSCWLDESANRRVADLCRAAHASVFDRRVLGAFAAAYTEAVVPTGKRRLRRTL